jgi:hypothetical protein
MKRAILAVLLFAAVARCQCLTAGNLWQNTTEPAQTQTFTLDADVTPVAAPVDLVIGLSNGPAASWPNLAAIVRFDSSTGTLGTGPVVIDAMNAAAYASSPALPYSAGLTYHVHMVVRPGAQTYDVYITPPGGAVTEIATAFAFRTSAGVPTSLNNFATFDDAGKGSDQICNLTVAAVSTPPPVVTPPAAPGTFTATGTTAAGTLTVSGTGTTGQPASAQFSTSAPVSFTFAATSHSVVLTWVASTSAGVTGYNVLRSASASFAGVYATTSGTTYTDTAVTPGATYEYTVQAVSANGTSGDSNVVTVTIPSP